MGDLAHKRYSPLWILVLAFSVSCTFDMQGVGIDTGESMDSGVWDSPWQDSATFDSAGIDSSTGGGGIGGHAGMPDGGSDDAKDAGDTGPDPDSGSPDGSIADAVDVEKDADPTCKDEPCGPFGTCEQLDGAVHCSCLDGFEWEIEKGCVDIDECTMNTHDCSSLADCTNTPGSYLCKCIFGTLGDGKTCRHPTSCVELANTSGGLYPTGIYVIDTGKSQLETVFCDMTSDDGVGYTMVKYEDPSLQGHQDAYHNLCKAHGLEVIVPRTRAHAKGIVTWLGMPPNLVGVYPKKDKNAGLDTFEGRCQAQSCSFYMSDSNNSDCKGTEPNGNNETKYGLIRVDNSNECGFWGRWDDHKEKVNVQGWVVCSTNDTGPIQPRKSCKAYLDTDSVWNVSARGISGRYEVDPDEAGPLPKRDLLCEQVLFDGGWTMAFVANSRHVGKFHGFCASDENLADLTRWAEDSSKENTARHGWIDLNSYAFEHLALAAYKDGNSTYISNAIARSDIRIPFGQNGYFLFGSAGGYNWCGGAKDFTDGGTGQVNQPPGAPDNCKGHSNLGSGWDFSQSMVPNSGLTLCGNDGASFMSSNATGDKVNLGTKGAAQAIWVR